MKQVLQYPQKQGLVIEECPVPACKPGGILVDNRFSLISPGTERAIIDLASQSLVGKARSRPDLVKQVLEKVRSEGLITTINKVKSRLKIPVPLGYSSCGVVVEVGQGVSEFRVGDRVACAGFGYATHAERIFVPKNLAVILPAQLQFQEGTFVTLGSIALWGVRQAHAGLGNRVVVIGLGLLGQLTVQILKASGCQVIGVDIDEDRLAEASRFGLDLVVRATDPNTEKAIWHFTEGLGADAVIITAATRSNQPIELAAAVCRDRGKVTVVGDVKMAIPRKPFYDKELSLNLSRSYGPGRYDSDYEEKGHDYPPGFVRWTENRNMQAFLELVAAGKVKLQPLMTATYSIAEAADAFAAIETGKTLGMLLEYPCERVVKPMVTEVRPRDRRKKTLNIGFLGAGNFATGMLLPTMRKIKQLKPYKLYSATPHKAKTTADMFGFSAVADSEQEIFLDPNVDAVMIATPHYLHAQQVVKALQANKQVFVEKPLCLTISELKRVQAAWAANGGTLMVGFNRRYSIVAQKIREKLAERRNPIVFNYLVNAGFVPKKSWLQDDKLGGGRVIGECCHFLDLIAYLTSADIEEIKTDSISQQKGNYRVDDNITICLHLTDGSTGTITYTSLGDKSFPKETMTIFSDGMTLSMSNFKLLELYKNGRKSTLYSGRMDKGISSELRGFADFCENGQPEEGIETIFNSSLATLLAVESLRTGRSVKLPTKGNGYESATESALSQSLLSSGS